MADEPNIARKSFGHIAPALAEITDKVLFGEVWGRRGLSPRDRSLITVASLIALYRDLQAIEEALSKISVQGDRYPATLAGMTGR